MRSLYRWNPRDASQLGALEAPVVAARTIDATSTGESTIEHALLGTPEELAAVTERWAGRGPLATLLPASCLTDRTWQERWIGPLRSAGPAIVLIDVELDRFVGSWANRGAAVRAGAIHVADTSASYWAATFLAEDQPELWMAVADEITVRLLLEQLQRTPGLHCEQTTSHLTAWSDLLPSVLTHLLATESFLDFEGMADHAASG